MIERRRISFKHKVRWTCVFAYARLRNCFSIRAKSFRKHAYLFRDRKGMEIGGYSQVFSQSGIFPAYAIAGSIDNCNFSGATVWEGEIKEGLSFQFNCNKPLGRQYVIEATSMESIPTSSYDFILSSHALEHIANPILALSEWIRVLKHQGVLVLLLPHKDRTFDRHRPVTAMQHLVADFEAGISEHDLTHMPEILALHDFSLDPEAGDPVAFRSRSERNFENRCFHHHVFDTQLAVNLVDHMGLKIRAVETLLPMHILIIAEKAGGGGGVDNSAFTGVSAKYHQNSPFLSDHSSATGGGQ